MLTYAETAYGRTIVQRSSIPCHQSQEITLTTLSYVIGPIDAAQIIILHEQLAAGEMCSLLVPVDLPRHIFDHPLFHDGYAYNFLSEEESDEQEDWTSIVTRLVNHIYSSLTDDRFSCTFDTAEVSADSLPWHVGWLLRDLTRLAETDHLLAYTGLAHLCFVLPLLTQRRPAAWPRYEPYHAGILHDRAVRAYRARVRGYREQSKSYDEAQRLGVVKK